MLSSTHYSLREELTLTFAVTELSGIVDISLVAILRQVENLMKMGGILGERISSMMTKLYQKILPEFVEFDVEIEEELAGDME